MNNKEGLYAVLGVGILFVSTRVVKIDLGHIFALFLIASLLYYVQNVKKKDRKNVFEVIETKIRCIGKPKHFYIDTNAIDFFYDYLGWRKLNPDNYDRCVEAVDNVLRLLLDTEKPLIRCVDHYHTASNFGSVALNLFHGFVYVIHEPILLAKLDKALLRLEGLISRYLKQMKHNCAAIERAKGSRDVNWSFIHDENVPHPYDQSETEFNFYGAIG